MFSGEASLKKKEATAKKFKDRGLVAMGAVKGKDLSFEERMARGDEKRRRNRRAIRRQTKKLVFSGVRHHTAGGLLREDLTIKGNGEVVVAKKQEHPWRSACAKARRLLGVKGFAPVKTGTSLP